VDDATGGWMKAGGAAKASRGAVDDGGGGEGDFTAGSGTHGDRTAVPEYAKARVSVALLMPPVLLPAARTARSRPEEVTV
jgi:hypothetical protein